MTAPSSYRLARVLRVRFLGAVLVLAGLLLLAFALLAALVDLPGGAWAVAVLVVAAAIVVAFISASRSSLVRLDDAGYRVRLLRGAGVSRARWRDVEDVVTATLSGHDCVVLRLRDGQATTIPVRVLDTSPDVLVRDLGQRLDAAHGYRRLR